MAAFEWILSLKTRISLIFHSSQKYKFTAILAKRLLWLIKPFIMLRTIYFIPLYYPYMTTILPLISHVTLISLSQMGKRDRYDIGTLWIIPSFVYLFIRKSSGSHGEFLISQIKAVKSLFYENDFRWRLVNYFFKTTISNTQQIKTK